jgi:hypothetical protein
MRTCVLQHTWRALKRAVTRMHRACVLSQHYKQQPLITKFTLKCEFAHPCV